jgi:hypothetical protein
MKNNILDKEIEMFQGLLERIYGFTVSRAESEYLLDRCTDFYQTLLEFTLLKHE